MKNPLNNRTRVAVAAALLAVAGMTTALASSDDHDRARTALQAGEIQPLVNLLPKVTADGSDRVIEVELERKHGRWVYEFKTIESNGMVRETKVDAKTGDILETEYDDDDDQSNSDKYRDRDDDKHRRDGYDDGRRSN